MPTRDIASGGGGGRQYPLHSIQRNLPAIAVVDKRARGQIEHLAPCVAHLGQFGRLAAEATRRSKVAGGQILLKRAVGEAVDTLLTAAFAHQQMGAFLGVLHKLLRLGVAPQIPLGNLNQLAFRHISRFLPFRRLAVCFPRNFP